MAEFIMLLALLAFVYQLTKECFGEDVFGQKNKMLTLFLFQKQENPFVELKDFKKIKRNNKVIGTLHGENNDVMRLYYTRRPLLNVSRSIVTLLAVLVVGLTFSLIISQQENLFVFMFTPDEEVPAEAYAFSIAFVAFIILSVWTLANRLRIKSEIEKLSYIPLPPTPVPASTPKEMQNMLTTFFEFLRRLEP